MDVGERVRELRKERGMTQEQLAKAVEVDQVYISRIENGRLKHVPTEVARKMAIFFHISLEYLLTGEEGDWEPEPDNLSFQEFLTIFLGLSHEKQAQVMAFTTFIAEYVAKDEEQLKDDDTVDW